MSGLFRNCLYIFPEITTTKVLEQLLVPEVRIIRDKNLFQIIDDGRQIEFHRTKSFPMYLSKHRKTFSIVSLIGRDTVNVRISSMKGSGAIIP